MSINTGTLRAVAILGLFGTVIASGVLGVLIHSPEESARVGSPLIHVAMMIVCCGSFSQALIRMAAEGDVLRRPTRIAISDTVMLWVVSAAVSVVGLLILRAMFGTS